MRYFFYIFIGILVFCQPAQADAKVEVKTLLKEKIDRVFFLLQDENLDEEKRHDEIIDTVNPIIDFQIMAKLSLGKKYWPSLSKEEKKAFSDLFIRRLQDSYLNQLKLYTDEEVTYKEPLKVKSKIHVPTLLLSKGQEISMLYKFYKSKRGGWKVYDLVVADVSVIQTYRSQFDSVLKKGDFQDLLAKLKETVELPSSESDEKSDQ